MKYDRVGLPMREKDFSKIEKRAIFALTYFVMKTSWFFQFVFLIKNLKTQLIYYS